MAVGVVALVLVWVTALAVWRHDWYTVLFCGVCWLAVLVTLSEIRARRR